MATQHQLSRVDPPFAADEATMLEAWLEHHRGTLLYKCEGLRPEQLALRAVPPSPLSLLGIVRHMSQVEASWFRRCLTGEQLTLHYSTKEDPDADFDGATPESAEEAFATYEAECENSRRILADSGSLDDLGQHARFGDVSLRWILLHMIEEYARHNGHADLLRECIDGDVGS
jgi:uncharacterized damage-inducible protein DinB